MTTLTPELEDKLRQGFKYLNHFMVMMWRLGLGKWLNLWPAGLGRYLVITHIGRKSGLRRRTPVNYAQVAEEVYVTAGFGSGCDWYRNLRANPQVEIWLPDGWWTGVAEEVLDPAKRLPILRQVIIDSGFAGRVFGLNPHTMTDEEFDRVTGAYRLLRLRRVAPLTGEHGPGDLAWIWPGVAMVLLPLVLFRRKN
jgi:deazaflavin-dependent oxidoreductase (nitroreductase family)